jgi:hypothetical protein
MDSRSTPQTPGIDPRFKALADKAAAQARIPGWLRSSGSRLPSFEDKAVAQLVKWSGRGDISAIRVEARRHKPDSLATFATFRRLNPDFPAVLTAGKFAFDYDGIATELLNDPTQTPIWSAYCDARDSNPDGYLGLVFSWPRVKKSHGLCVFHDVPRDDTPIMEIGKLGKADKRAAFRIHLPILGGIYCIEPMPAFLWALGWYGPAATASQDDDDA